MFTNEDFFENENTPELIEQYNNLISEVNRISDSEEIKKDLWNVIKMITIADEPLDIDSLFKLLSIEAYKKEIIIQKLNPYINIELDEENIQILSWNKLQFQETLINRIPITPSDRLELAKIIINYVEIKTKKGYIWELSYSLINNFMFFFKNYFRLIAHTSEPTITPFQYIKDSSFYKKINHISIDSHKDSIFLYLNFIFASFLINFEKEAIAFHYLYSLGILNKKIKILDSKPIFRILSFIKYSSSAKKLLKDNKSNQTELLDNALDLYKKMELSSNDIQIILNHIIVSSKVNFHHKESLFENCDKFSKLWCSNEVDKVIQIIENGEKNYIPMKKLSELLKNKTTRSKYAIIFDDSNNQIWIFGNSYKSTKLSMKFFRFISQKIPGDSITLEDLNSRVWLKKNHTDKIDSFDLKDTDIDRMDKFISRYIINRNKKSTGLNKYLVFDKSSCLQINKQSSFLYIYR